MHRLVVMSTVRSMRDLLLLAVHLLVTFAKLLRPGGVRAVAAESLLLKHQLLAAGTEPDEREGFDRPRSQLDPLQTVGLM